MHVNDERGLPAVRDVSLAVRAGEIVGIAGVEGNGQSELIEAITGLRHAESGEVVVAGEVVHRPSARRMLDVGVGHIPEDRQRRGLVLEFSIAENIALHDYNKPPDSRLGWLFPRRLIERARDADQGVRHPRRRPADALAARSPGATSRRWWPPVRWRATRRC